MNALTLALRVIRKMMSVNARIRQAGYDDEDNLAFADIEGLKATLEVLLLVPDVLAELPSNVVSAAEAILNGD